MYLCNHNVVMVDHDVLLVIVGAIAHNIDTRNKNFHRRLYMQCIPMSSDVLYVNSVFH